MQGLSYRDYVSRPLVVDSLVIVDGNKRTKVRLRNRNALVLLNYFQNPVPGNVWAIRTADGEWVPGQLDGLRCELDPRGRVSDILANVRQLGALSGPNCNWKSLTTGEIAQFFRQDKCFSYHSATEHLPRFEVDEVPKAIFMLGYWVRIPIRLLYVHHDLCHAITEDGYTQLRDRPSGNAVHEYALPLESIRLVPKNDFQNGQSFPEAHESLLPYLTANKVQLPPSTLESCLLGWVRQSSSV